MDYEDIVEQILYSENDEELFQKYKDNENIMEIYLPLRPRKYKEMSSKIRRNIKICKEIVKRNPLFFEDLDFEVKNNQELIEVAVDVHAANYKYAIFLNNDFKRNITLKMLNKEYDLHVKSVEYNLDYENFDKLFYDDKEVIVAWVKHDTSILNYIDNKYLNDIDVASAALEHWGMSILYFSSEILNNKELVMKAVKKTPVVYERLNKNLLTDDEDIKRIYDNSIVRININDILNFMDSNVKQEYDYGVAMEMPYIIEKSFTDDLKERICSIIYAMLSYDDPYIFQVATMKYNSLMYDFNFLSSEILGVKTKKIIKYCNIDSKFIRIKNDDSIEITQEDLEIIESIKNMLNSNSKLNDEDILNNTINFIRNFK